MSAGRPPKHDEACARIAVRLTTEEGLSQGQACRDEGVPPRTYRRWKERQATAAGVPRRPRLEVLAGRKKPPTTDPPPDNPFEDDPGYLCVSSYDLVNALASKSLRLSQELRTNGADAVEVYHSDLEALYWGAVQGKSWNAALATRKELARVQRADVLQAESVDPVKLLTPQELEDFANGKYDRIPAAKMTVLKQAAAQGALR